MCLLVGSFCQNFKFDHFTMGFVIFSIGFVLPKSAAPKAGGRGTAAAYT